MDTSLRPQVNSRPSTSPAKQWHAALPAAMNAILTSCTPMLMFVWPHARYQTQSAERAASCFHAILPIAALACKSS